ncbi:YqzG/YhdC family protein [Rossellomorea vietnamensis]|uniref:YqzG/YhdC family protein n=1 Tax=Rossellomorea vietnamensis TaxID=218284 RepID=UPI003D2AD37D
MLLKLFRLVSIVLCLMVMPNLSIGDGTHILQAQQEIPSYAKWGSLAVRKTKERYPDAAIVDYLHIGKEYGTKTSTEKFKLWLRRGGKEFGVFVDIQFETESEKLLDIKFKETDR